MTSASALRSSAHLSVAERVREFNLNRNTSKLTATKLRGIFKQAKIKFKKVITKTRSRRNQTAESLARDANIFTELVKYYSRCLRFDQEVILIDEAVFS